MTITKRCPCNSSKRYAACCEPLVSGKHTALPAEALMRSRFTAWVLRDINYLLASWHPSTRPITIDPVIIPDWTSLQIIRTEKGREIDTEGVVELRAIAMARKNFCRFQEVSRFVKENGQWFLYGWRPQRGPCSF